MKILLGVPLLVITLLGCADENKKDETKTISFQYEDKALNVDHIVKIKSIIPLETNDSTLIGSVYKVILNEDRYWLLDTKRTAVYCFNNKGEFVYRIHNQGKGPEEYFTISDILFSSDGDDLILYDAFSKKFLYYTIDSGFLEKVTNLKVEGMAPQGIHPLDDSTFLGGMANAGSNNLITFNFRGDILDQYLTVSDRWKDIYFLEQFSEFDGRILYPYQMDGKIYEYKDSVWKIRYTIDLGQEEMHESVKLARTGNLFERTNAFEQEIDQQGYILAPVDVRETKEFVLIQAKYKSQLIWGIHDKATKTSLLPGAVVTKHIPESLVERFPFATRDDSVFVTVAYPSRLLQNINSIDIKSDKFSLSGLKRNDNPVIVEYTLSSLLGADQVKILPNYDEISRLDELINQPQFKDKILIINLYNRYCGFSTSEFRHLPELKKLALNLDDVVFIHLSTPKLTSTNDWKGAIKEHNLEGYHVLMNNDFYDEFWKNFSNETHPTPFYLHVDKYKNISEIPRPSILLQMSEQNTPFKKPTVNILKYVQLNINDIKSALDHNIETIDVLIDFNKDYSIRNISCTTTKAKNKKDTVQIPAALDSCIQANFREIAKKLALKQYIFQSH